MSRHLVPTQGAQSWKELLADPAKQWRTGYSARSLAYAWEEAEGFPAEVETALATSTEPALREAEMLLGIPEHQVALPGRGRPSQNDLWVLARGAGETISIAVEGKVSEPFGPTVGEWARDASPNKKERLGGLASLLGLSEPIPDEIRYQLLHRAASAVTEAKRFGATHAVLLIHSFSQTHKWLEDYERFLSLYGCMPSVGRVDTLVQSDAISLHGVWVRGAERYLRA